jgi:hypothetical protein
MRWRPVLDSRKFCSVRLSFGAKSGNLVLLEHEIVKMSRLRST